MDTEKLLRKVESAIAQLESVRAELLDSGPKIPESIATEAAAGICHFCKLPLGGEKPVRGVHPTCNQRMTRAKLAGQCTDQQLMAEGKIGPRSKSGRKPIPLDDYVSEKAKRVAEDLEKYEQRKRRKSSNAPDKDAT